MPAQELDRHGVRYLVVTSRVLKFERDGFEWLFVVPEITAVRLEMNYEPPDGGQGTTKRVGVHHRGGSVTYIVASDAELIFEEIEQALREQHEAPFGLEPRE